MSAEFEQLSCQEFVELVTDWMEGELPEPVRTAIEEHLVICPPCGDYVAQVRAALHTLQRAESEPPSPPRRDDLLAAFRASRLS
jgi:predicted anti-sigma-YlaC factor YlaD